MNHYISDPKCYVGGMAPPNAILNNQNNNDIDGSQYDSISDSDSYGIGDIFANNVVFSDSDTFSQVEVIHQLHDQPPNINFNNYNAVSFSNCNFSDSDSYSQRIIDVVNENEEISIQLSDCNYFSDTVSIGDETINLCTIQSCNVELSEYSIYENTENVDDQIQARLANNNNGSNKIIEFQTLPIKWWINVPVQLDNNTVITVKMMADTGANHPVMNTQFAIDNFRNKIQRNRRNATINTPNGIITPIWCLYLLFPTKDGTLLKVKFILIDQLPVTMIADLNLLKHFGYQVSCPTPPIFRHEEELDPDMGIKDEDDMYNMTDYDELHNRYDDDSGDSEQINTIAMQCEKYKQCKINQYMTAIDNTIKNIRDDISHVEEVRTTTPNGDNYAIYHMSYGHINQCHEYNKQDKIIMYDVDKNIEYLNNYDEKDSAALTLMEANLPFNGTEDFTIKNNKLGDEFDGKIFNNATNGQTVNYINELNEKILDSVGTRHLAPETISDMTMKKNRFQRKKQMGFLMAKLHKKNRFLIKPRTDNFLQQRNNNNNGRLKHVNFVFLKHHFMATQDEIDEAKQLPAKRYYEQPKVEYLHGYHKLYGKNKRGLYGLTKNMINEYDDVFAKHTYSRRDMNVTPVKLGIKPEYKNITIYTPQYPLTRMKRLWYMRYIYESVDNGYMVRIPSTLHSNAVTMIPKKQKDGTVIWRPAIDARKLNQYCELWPMQAPTMKDIDNLFATPGFTVLCDMKNWFDCIPVHMSQWMYQCIHSPIGIYMIKCGMYGAKNMPFHAQNISNNMCVEIEYTQAFMDDQFSKYPMEWSAEQLINQEKRRLQYCRDKGMLINPEKYFPFVTECVTMGIKRTMNTNTISESYKQKIIEFPLPTTIREIKAFIGVIGYISRYIYKASHLKYYLNIVIKAFEKKRGKIKWDDYPEAKLAFEQIKYLVNNAPLLYNPTKDGKYMIKTDASMNAIGGALYQWQYDSETDEYVWRLIDMYSRVMSKGLRDAHSIVQEATGVQNTCQFWIHHLAKRLFIIWSDNGPAVNILDPKRVLTHPVTTQRQLFRIQMAMRIFNYEIRHIPGIHNELADGLSRFTIKYINNPKNNYKKGNNEFIIPIRAVTSDDTKPREMNERDYERMNQYQLNTMLLNSNLDDSLINNNINILMADYMQNNDFLLNMTDVAEIEDKNWNELMCICRTNINYLYKERMALLINSADGNILRSTDEAFNTLACNDCINELLDVTRQLAMMSYESIDKYQQIQENTIQYQSKILGAASTICPTDVEVDKLREKLNESKQTNEYYYSEYRMIGVNPPAKDIEKPDEREHPMQTRSQAIEDAIKQIRRSDYVDEKLDNVYHEQKVRAEFINDLFGYRLKSDIFNEKNILKYQNGDTTLILVRGILGRIRQEQIDRNILIDNINIDTIKFKPTIGITNKIIELISDIQMLYKMDTGLATGILNGDIIEQFGNNIISKRILKDYRNEQLDDPVWAYVVPNGLKGKIMDWAHHNLNSNHHNADQTYQQLWTYYWWTDMKYDINAWVRRCLTCTFLKGTIRHRSPMQLRQLSVPREHIMADYLECNIGGIKRYILVLIDYSTGWTMLIPCNNNDVITCATAFINSWIPLHGLFSYIDTDYGGSFSATTFQLLNEALGTNLQYAEPRKHRSTGKVERVIQFIQNYIRRFNIQLNNTIIETEKYDPEKAWKILCAVTPHIQAAINQYRSRISGYSPNMKMFGRQMADMSNMGIVLKRMHKKYMDYTTGGAREIRGYVQIYELMKQINKIYQNFEQDWYKYQWVSKQYYDNKYHITEALIKKNSKQFKLGTLVLYWINDRYTSKRKYLYLFSGPWTITKILTDGNVIIRDNETNNEKRVTLDRLKVFKSNEYKKCSEIYDDKDYDAYQKRISDALYKHDKSEPYPFVDIDISKGDRL